MLTVQEKFLIGYFLYLYDNGPFWYFDSVRNSVYVHLTFGGLNLELIVIFVILYTMES